MKDLQLGADLRNATGEVRHRRGDERDDNADDERDANHHQGCGEQPRHLPFLERARRGRQHDADDEGGDDGNERLAGEIERRGDGDDGEDRERPRRYQPRPVRLLQTRLPRRQAEPSAIAPGPRSPPPSGPRRGFARACAEPRANRRRGGIVPGGIVFRSERRSYERGGSIAFMICGLTSLSRRFRRHRPDHLVGDRPVAPDDEGLRHAVDAPVDSRPAVRVEADLGVGVSLGAEKAAHVLGRILLRDAEDHHSLRLQRGVRRERHQIGMLEMAGLAPRAENIDDADMALAEIGVAQTRLAVEPGERQRRRALADQGRRQPRRVAARVQPERT